MTAYTFAKKMHRIGLFLSAIALLELATPKPAQADDWNTDNWLRCDIADCVQAPTNTLILPQSVADAVLKEASSQSGLPASDLQITTTKQVVWPNGCMGIGGRSRICTTVVIEGWIVTVKSSDQQWVYHTDNNSGVLLATNQNPDPIDDLLDDSIPGSSQLNPIVQDFTQDNWFNFTNVTTGNWFDPPTTYGFEYVMTDDSLFSNILDFPIGIDGDNLFTVSSKNRVLGQFSPGQSVDLVALLGEGVSELTISGIDSIIDPKSPTAFPLRLEFNKPKASFKMRAFDASERKAVPENTPVLGILAFGALGVGLQLKHKLNKFDA